MRKSAAFIAAAAVSLSAAADFPCGFAGFSLGISASAEGECTHANVTDNICTDCSTEMAAAVATNNMEYTYFATVEEAVAKANSTANIGYLYLTEDYTGDINLTRANANIEVASLGETPVTLTGNIKAENLFVLRLQNLTINGDVTAGENVKMSIYDGTSIKTLTANYQLDFCSGSAETVINNSFANFEGGTVGNVNTYHDISVYENTNITGVITLAEGNYITIQKNPLNTLTVKAGLGPVARFGQNADPAAFDLTKIVSADGYKVVLDENGVIEFVCEHESYTDGVCDGCGIVCKHESYTDGVCDECGIVCKHESYTDSVCDVCGIEATSIEKFVERLYNELLGRPSDKNGKAKWVEKLNNDAAAADVAVNFVLSAELKQQKLSNETFVKRMYETMLDRTPADKEVANWASYLDAGCTYAFVFRGFLTAPEFGRLCTSYGIETGTYAVTENRDVNGKLTKFISRLYTKALNRTYDVGGLNHHTGNYISGKYTLDKIASGFIFSPEFEKRKLSDEKFVECMYNTFFDRASDAKGKASWLQKMANGMTREEVFSGFVNSPEYKAFIKSAGID